MIQKILGTLQRWIVSHPVILAALGAYFYSLWSFLVGDNYFSTDFLQLHVAFEHAYHTLDNNFLSPAWLPLFQGGRSIFGEGANSFSPFGIDFILTYAVSKILFLDKALDLVTIDTWRLALLNIVFAIGCRQLARQVLKSRSSADFVFLITLFVGGFFLLHRPIFVTANVFSPWVLLYLTRLVMQGPERLLHNATGLTLATAANLFHQFNTQISFIWPYIALYALGLLIFGFWGPTLRAIRSQWASWKTKAALLLMAITIIISVLPLSWKFQMSNEHLVDPEGVSLLIHSDAQDGSNEFSDATGTGHVITANGDVQHSTNEKWMGGSAIYFDGDGDFLTIPDHEDWDFNTGPLTIDMWVYPTRLDNGSGILSLDGTNGASGGILFGYDPGNGTYNLFMSSTGSAWDIATGHDAGAITLFKWQHLALTRSEDVVRAFKDGDEVGSWPSSEPVFASSGPLTIGKAGGFYQGYIDEIRISKGVAQWTSSFAPPMIEYELSVFAGEAPLFEDMEFRYFGTLALLLVVVGLLFGTNRFRLPILASVLVYLLVALVGSSFVPYEFALLSLAPPLAILAGMGLERLLTIGELGELTPITPGDNSSVSRLGASGGKLKKTLLNFALTRGYLVDGLAVFIGVVLARWLFPWWLSAIVIGPILAFYLFSRYTQTPILQTTGRSYRIFAGLFRLGDPKGTVETLKILGVLAVTLVGALYLADKMIDDSGFATLHQNDLMNVVFVGVSLLALYLALDLPTPSLRLRLFTVVLLLDYLTFQYVAGQNTSLGLQDIQFADYQIAPLVDIPALFLTLVVSAYLIHLVVFVAWIKSRKAPL